MEPPPGASSGYACPYCNAPVRPNDVGVVSRCGHCGQQFLAAISVPAPADSAAQTEASEAPGGEADRPRELDGQRIARLATARRAALRSRSYALVALIGCCFAAAELAILSRRDVVGAGWGVMPVAYLLLAVAAVLCAIWSARAALRLHREIRRPMIGPPENPPDFAALGDGSHQLRRLQSLHAPGKAERGEPR